MNFLPYLHLEKLGKDNTDGILYGECYIFPKIDGTNASVWYDKGVCFGSRTRKLSLDNDNVGFMHSNINNKKLETFFDVENNKRYILYGEWLIPHTLKTYRESAWRVFYIFDVFDIVSNCYLPYPSYKDLLKEYELEFIPPLCIITNPTEETLLHALNSNVFLIADGKGYGEGIVVKNYSFINKYGRPCFAKIVSNEFKSNHLVEMGAPQLSIHSVESIILQEVLTSDMLDKVYAKLTLTEPWNKKNIPKFLGITWHDFIQEELWDILKKYNNPKIDFKRLNGMFIRRVKDLMPSLFV
jgi:RNA ligase